MGFFDGFWTSKAKTKTRPDRGNPRKKHVFGPEKALDARKNMVFVLGFRGFWKNGEFRDARDVPPAYQIIGFRARWAPSSTQK
jgi:hypothetical protein